MTLAGALAIACLFGFAASAQAATVTNLNDSGSGSLRAAVSSANDGDTIVFAEGLSGSIELTSPIEIEKSLTIAGPGASQLAIDGGHASRIFIVTAGNLSISGLTLANGAAPGDGGAINYESTGSLTVSDCAFTGNAAGEAGSTASPHGGAIYVLYHSGPLTISGCTFTDNSSGGAGGSVDYSGRSRGGAVEYDGEGSLTVTNSMFVGNTAGGSGGSGLQSGMGRGGAIFVHLSAASTSIFDSTFANNSAGGDGGSGNLSGRGEGGAIQGDSGTGPMTISGSTFAGNIAGGRKGTGSGSGAAVGGAIESFSALTVTNSTFTENAAGGQGGVGEGAFGFGGAIKNFNNVDPLTISGSTFNNNSAGGQGGEGHGGAISVSSISSRSISISNSTFSGNAAGGGGGAGHGGAIDVGSSVSTSLASVTIDGNAVGSNISATGTGAGISGAAAVTAKATIVSGNTGAANCDGPVAAKSYSLEGPAGDTSCGFDLPSADPLLEPLADNGGPTETQALPESSPAVDAVPAAKCPTKVDQRGEPRPDNGEAYCDVGAYELQDPPVAPQITSTSAATFQIGKAGSFTVTATGVPIPSLVESGVLPGGVTFTDHGDGTASLTGTPKAGTGGSYPITVTASNGVTPDATQAFTLTVQAPPTVSIATPADGATYELGQVVSSSFTCAEGAAGSGIASCVDQDGHGSGGKIDTSTAGRHTFKVTATSKDGLTTTKSASYTVTSSPLVVSIRDKRLLVRAHRRVKAHLSCSGGTVNSVCHGTLWLVVRKRFERGAHGPGKTITLAHAFYAVRTGESKPIVLRLKRIGLRLLRRADKHLLHCELIASLSGGRSTYQAVSLKLKR